MKTVLLAAAAAAFLAVLPAVASDNGHMMVTPEDLKWSDVPSLPPGAKIAVIEGPLNEAVPFTVRLKVPANWQVPVHSHPAIERVTVLSGTFHMGIGDKMEKQGGMAVKAGSMMIMQPKTNHYAWTTEETLIQLNGTGPWGITYLNPADDPRKK